MPSTDEIRARLKAYEPQRQAPLSSREAAVLMPLIAGDSPLLLADGATATPTQSALNTLFLVRPESMRAHAGQVAFPGGVRDKGDLSPEFTALRETEEELGIPPSHVEIIGRLDAFRTGTGFHLTPIVGIIHDSPILQPSPAEVATTFQLPLQHFLNPAYHRTMRGSWRTLPQPPQAASAPRPVSVAPDIRYHFWPFAPYPVWGVTAQVIANFIQVLRASSPATPLKAP